MIEKGEGVSVHPSLPTAPEPRPPTETAQRCVGDAAEAVQSIPLALSQGTYI